MTIKNKIIQNIIENVTKREQNKMLTNTFNQLK